MIQGCNTYQQGMVFSKGLGRQDSSSHLDILFQRALYFCQGQVNHNNIQPGSSNSCRPFQKTYQQGMVMELIGRLNCQLKNLMESSNSLCYSNLHSLCYPKRMDCTNFSGISHFCCTFQDDLRSNRLHHQRPYNQARLCHHEESMFLSGNLLKNYFLEGNKNENYIEWALSRFLLRKYIQQDMVCKTLD